jgi:single-strand DNA-binding protein
MSDLNRVTLSGRLVADPELKYLPSGTAVTNLRLASNRSFTSNGERRDEAVFVDVEVYGKAGEALTQHKAKGDFLLVDGRLRQHTWERDGQRHSRLTVVADRSASAEHEGRRRRDAAGGGRGQGRPTVLKAGRVSTARTRLDTVLSSPHPRHP